MAHLNATRRQQGLPSLSFRAALHIGDILWGNIGAADRLDFTAIGPAVNLVSRLEGLCRTLDRAVLISGALAAETTATLIPLGSHALRGSPPALRRLHRPLRAEKGAPGRPHRSFSTGAPQRSV